MCSEGRAGHSSTTGPRDGKRGSAKSFVGSGPRGSGRSMRYGFLIFACLSAFVMGAEPQPKVAERLERRGDEIMVCGQLFHTTTQGRPVDRPGRLRRLPRRAPIRTPPDRAEAKAIAKEATKKAANAAERGSQPLRPADPRPDPGADRAGPRRRLGPAVAPAGRRPVRHPLRRARHQPADASRCSRTGAG